jgi:hypothetical protein
MRAAGKIEVRFPGGQTHEWTADERRRFRLFLDKAEGN